MFTDEEDSGQPRYTPGWNTLLTFRVPRWHLVTPVKARKVRWSIYGWSIEQVPSDWQRFVTFVTTKPLHVLGYVVGVLGCILFLKWVAPDPPATTQKKD